MVYCPSCRTENAEGSNFCLDCGISLPKSENQDTPRYSSASPNRAGSHPLARYTSLPRQDEITPIAYVCACCVPLAGFVIWAVIKDEKPESANSILIISIVSIIFTFIFGVAS